ncbi:hypothetical protein CC1G_02352 [Coprinopsis cinerea okayama7|uniref:Uncharacterized protein n=1 Tax=Coprinopsis cinerea (strain Okayama-7 / 130 / ATCC MYA-4618 / FGSC 9003) TaxID=240176 RepID=A8N7U5_COPC7|nr:hypothetical protein CC1G_02352 [Coprinopsis cinerea okayama7\|eukprot:XP_001830901.1 hypothetical protein CC1G_02352 [Coprinopsis cinerea okayama7\
MDPRIEPLISNNHVPDPIHIPYLTDELSKTSKELSSTHQKIELVEQFLAGLHSRHTLLAKKESAMRDTLSPLRAFPPELLGELFRACLPLMLDAHGRRQFAILRAVCRAWREVTFSTPHLWPDIQVDIVKRFGTIQYEPLPTPAQLQSWFTDRARSKPLSFNLAARIPINKMLPPHVIHELVKCLKCSVIGNRSPLA